MERGFCSYADKELQDWDRSVLWAEPGLTEGREVRVFALLAPC